MRISDWSSDVCSSDLLDESGACGDRRFSDPGRGQCGRIYAAEGGGGFGRAPPPDIAEAATGRAHGFALDAARHPQPVQRPPGHDLQMDGPQGEDEDAPAGVRSEEHTSELKSLMRISYAVFCLKKKQIHKHKHEQKPIE